MEKSASNQQQKNNMATKPPVPVADNSNSDQPGSSNSQMAERWYIMNPDTRVPEGPFSRWVVVSRYTNERISRESELWLDGTPSGWKQLCEFGELRNVLPNGTINDDAIVEFDIHNDLNMENGNNNLQLTRDNLENKLWYYKNEWQKTIGPIPLSEVFYMLEANVIGRNTEIQEENSELWRRVEDVQKQFAQEWQETQDGTNNGNDGGNGGDNGGNGVVNGNDGGDEEEEEKEDDDVSNLKNNPDFFNPQTRFLAELEMQFKKDEKQMKKLDQQKKNNSNNKNESKNKDSKNNDNPNDTNQDKNVEKSNVIGNQGNKPRIKRKRESKKSNLRKTAIYITGLPLDIDKGEMFEFFSQAGIIKKNALSGEMMIKLYHDDKTLKPKGDALITYLKQESVKIAIDRFDETEIRPNYPIQVTHASFSFNNNNNSNSNNNDNDNNINDDFFDLSEPKRKRQRRSKRNKNKNKKNNNNNYSNGRLTNDQRYLTSTQKDILSKMNNQESLLSWDDDVNAQVPQLSIVILKNMFNLNDIRLAPYNGNEYLFYSNLKKEVMDECRSKIGNIEKCDIYEGHPQGIIKLKFEYPKDASKCISIMNRRYFDERIVECTYWDGTDYTIRESIEEQAQRLKQFQTAITK